MLKSLFYSILAKGTIIAFLKKFVSPQHIPSIQSVIQKQPSKELDLWYTLGLPNPKNRPVRLDIGKMVLVIFTRSVILRPPNKAPGIINIRENRLQFC